MSKLLPLMAVWACLTARVPMRLHASREEITAATNKPVGGNQLKLNVPESKVDHKQSLFAKIYNANCLANFMSQQESLG